MAPLLLSTCDIHWLARPHVIGWLFLLACRTLRARLASAIPVLRCRRGRAVHRRCGRMSTPASSCAAIAVISPSPLRRWRRRLRAWYPPGRLPWPPLAPLLESLRLATVPSHVFRYLTELAELLSRIGEFQSFDFHTRARADHRHRDPRHRRRRAGPDPAALRSISLLAMLYLRPGAALGPRTAAGGPAAAAPGQCRRSPPPSRSPLASLRANVSAPSDSASGGARPGPRLLLRRRLRRCGCCRWGFPPAQFPVAAYPHIPAERAPVRARQVRRLPDLPLHGARKVFFDGRSDLYGAEFLKQYGRMVQVRPGWRRVLGLVPLHPRAAARGRSLCAGACSRPAGGPFTRTGPPSCWRETELNMRACVTTEHRHQDASSGRVSGRLCEDSNGSTEETPDFRRRRGSRPAC